MLFRLIAEIWEHSNNITMKSDGAENASGQTFKQVVNKAAVTLKYTLYHFLAKS